MNDEVKHDITDSHELEIRRRIKKMRDDELVDFVRETIVRLDALADRLEVFADKEAGRDPSA